MVGVGGGGSWTWSSLWTYLPIHRKYRHWRTWQKMLKGCKSWLWEPGKKKQPNFFVNNNKKIETEDREKEVSMYPCHKTSLELTTVEARWWVYGSSIFSTFVYVWHSPWGLGEHEGGLRILLLWGLVSINLIAYRIRDYIARMLKSYPILMK